MSAFLPINFISLSILDILVLGFLIIFIIFLISNLLKRLLSQIIFSITFNSLAGESGQ